MAGMTGISGWIKFGSVVLNTDYRAFNPAETGGVVDQSGGADTERTYLTTLKDGTATASLAIQTGAGTLVWAAVAPLTGGTLWWAEEGSAVNKQVHLVYAYVTERRKSLAYADLAVADVTWQFGSAVVDSAFPAI